MCCRIVKYRYQVWILYLLMLPLMLNFIFKQDVFVKHYATATKSEKVFLHKGQSQGHKVIDRGVI